MDSIESGFLKILESFKKEQAGTAIHSHTSSILHSHFLPPLGKLLPEPLGKLPALLAWFAFF